MTRGWPLRRSSIAELLALMLVLAVGLAALRSASATWAGVASLLTCAALLAAVLGVICRRGAGRASCLGFALFGWAYYLACFAPWCVHEVQPWLPTSRLLDEAYARWRPVPPKSATGRLEFWDFYNREYIKLNPYSYWVEGRDHFRRSGQALASLIAGSIGAAISRRLHRGRVARPTRAPGVPLGSDRVGHRGGSTDPGPASESG